MAKIRKFDCRIEGGGVGMYSTFIYYDNRRNYFYIPLPTPTHAILGHTQVAQPELTGLEQAYHKEIERFESIYANAKPLEKVILYTWQDAEGRWGETNSHGFEFSYKLLYREARDDEAVYYEENTRLSSRERVSCDELWIPWTQVREDFFKRLTANVAKINEKFKELFLEPKTLLLFIASQKNLLALPEVKEQKNNGKRKTD